MFNAKLNNIRYHRIDTFDVVNFVFVVAMTMDHVRLDKSFPTKGFKPLVIRQDNVNKQNRLNPQEGFFEEQTVNQLLISLLCMFVHLHVSL